MSSLTIVFLFVIGALALIDYKVKAIPSIFLTGLILMVALIKFENFDSGLTAMAFGVLALIYGRLLYEGKFIGGVADIKIICLIGLMISNVLYFALMMVAVLIFGLAFKLFYFFVLDKKSYDEIPFIPCLYLVYIILFILGGVS